MSIIRTGSEDFDSLKNRILLRIWHHRWVGSKTKHHINVKSILCRGNEENELRALEEMEKEGVIQSKNYPALTKLGLAIAIKLRKQFIENQLYKQQE